MASEPRHVYRSAFFASLCVVPIWIFFSFYERGSYYFSSVVGLKIGLFVLALGTAIGFLATLVLGVPLLFFMSKRGIASPGYLVLVGILVPALVFLIVGGFGATDLVNSVVNLAGFSFTGFVVSLTFWYLTVGKQTQL